MSDKNKKRLLSVAKILLCAVFAVVMVFVMFGIPGTKEVETIAYSEFLNLVKNSQVVKVTANTNSTEISILLKEGTEKEVLLPNMEEFTSFITKEIQNGANIEFSVVDDNSKMIKGILKTVMQCSFYIFIVFVMTKTITKTSNGKYKVESVNSEVKFSDVAGINEEKAQLEEIVEFLKNPDKYNESGAKIPKGVLLTGAPGTGKTLLAKAIAGEAGVPFFQVTGSSFEEKFVGVGAARVRDLFKKAKEEAPSIIFIDEIDSVAKSRYGVEHSHSEQSLNQLLAEMDGFQTKDNVIVIAATNYINVLDKAIIRPGRFDRLVTIPMPDIKAREKILEVHSKNKKLSDDVSLKEIARKTVGFSGADLENILNEAAIYSVNNGSGVIDKAALDEAIARVLVGLEKKNTAISETEKRLTAIHEAGHAIVSALVRPNVKNLGISIVPRGKAGGYNYFDESDKVFYTKNDLYKNIQVLYGGRIAEELVLGDVSTGSSNDLENASRIVYKMITSFAMQDSVSFLTQVPGKDDFNNQLIESRMDEMEEICKRAYNEASVLVSKNKDVLLELADLLIEKEYLPQEEVEKFMSEKFK